MPYYKPDVLTLMDDTAALEGLRSFQRRCIMIWFLPVFGPGRQNWGRDLGDSDYDAQLRKKRMLHRGLAIYRRKCVGSCADVQ